VKLEHVLIVVLLLLLVAVWFLTPTGGSK